MTRAFFMYIISSLFLFFEMAVQVSPSVMTNQLMSSLNIGAFGLGIMSGCYFYTYAAMQVPSGVLFDRYNPRLVTTFSLLICVAGALLLSIASNIYIASAARLLMGFGSAFAFVSVLVVTADLFPSKYFATMTGVTQMLAALGAMSGQLPVHLMVDNLGWRQTMLALAIVGFMIAMLILFGLKYKSKHKQAPTEDKKIIEPLKKILACKQSWFIALYAFLLWTPMSAFTSLWGKPFLQKVDQLSAGPSAFLTSLMWIGLAVASPLLGALSTKINNRKGCLAISALFGFVSFFLILFFRLPDIILGILLFISGAACAGQALSFTLVKENNPASRIASAITFNNMAVVISGALFQPFIGWLLEYLPGTECFQYRAALTVVLLAYGIGCLIAVFLVKEPLRNRTMAA